MLKCWRCWLIISCTNLAAAWEREKSVDGWAAVPIIGPHCREMRGTAQNYPRYQPAAPRTFYMHPGAAMVGTGTNSWVDLAQTSTTDFVIF